MHLIHHKKLSGRIALVDGADLVTGQETVAQLIAAGATVIAVGTDNGALTALAKKHGKKCLPRVISPYHPDPVGKVLAELDAPLRDAISIFISRMPLPVTEKELPGSSPLEKDIATTYQTLDRTVQAVHHISNIMAKHGKPSDIIIMNGMYGKKPDSRYPCLSACQQFLTFFTDGVDSSIQQYTAGTLKRNFIRLKEFRLSESVAAAPASVVGKKLYQYLNLPVGFSESVIELKHTGEKAQSFGITPLAKIKKIDPSRRQALLHAPTSLTDKIIAITGATDGIGRYYAEQLLQRGVRVIAIGRNTEKIADLRAQYPADRLHILKLDISKGDAVQTAFDNLPEHWKAIDVLINNAGLDKDGGKTFPETDIGNISKIIGCNIRGALHCNHAVLPGMIAREKGDIVHTGSTAGVQPYPAAVYCGTKAAMPVLAMALDAHHKESPALLRILCSSFGVTASSFAQHRNDYIADNQMMKQKVEETYGQDREPLSPKDCFHMLLSALESPRNLIAQNLFWAQYQGVQGLGRC